MDKLLARLSEQKAVLNQQNEALRSRETEDALLRRLPGHTSSTNSLPITPATEGFPSTAPSSRPASATLDDGRSDADEVLRLKLELAQAQTQISKLGQELSTRSRDDESDMHAMNMTRGGAVANSRETTWVGTADDDQSDTSDSMSASAFGRAKGIWAGTKGTFGGNALTSSIHEPQLGTWFGGRGGFNPAFPDTNGPYHMMEGYRGDRLSPDSDLGMRPSAMRRPHRYDHRVTNSHHLPSIAYNSIGGGPMAQYETLGTVGEGPMASRGSIHPPPGLGTIGMGPYAGYQQQPVGTPLSPHASEFTSKTSWKTEASAAASPRTVSWAARLTKTQGLATDGPTYLPPTEPLNYRRLLDRNVTCNWKYIVDKIVCNNDQQASIFLQQKLKVGTPEQKYDIVEAIVAQAYPLMVNRFGNFLVQRCFEHGTPEQVIKIAQAIRGNSLNLSMDPFGCHVVQKAFDSVPEEYKAIMVHELLRRIPETVIHRYACHVWQKLFELRWTESPPQIMKYVNEALRGMWHEVALGETGSLVVQNIFENCLEEDKVRLPSVCVACLAEHAY